ncbi:type II toxin-antitoxin system HicB family antitoxin [Sporolactobacillus shoreicorticis]|uniref:Type II toxin-antitoxin system HicB family antitoxin n=1 Tax=Sporolactobacillus shoreicorticis TaxID=1923877 RepID=A0ABW5S6H2_9BACL|nr:type II toxin-antitoxin system HicB family antitoxin [Sporolactobacillus shoreicorticis]MCO7125690.1 type II toxin-antitoxin system HicB family antitoxin [Sporolactobacillus shoreicorticis]
MSKDQYIYPALFTNNAERLTITFPDLPDCSAEAQNVEDGFARAKEALALFIYALEEKGEQPPDPSEVTAIHTEQDQLVTLIETWMSPFRKKMENQAVKKTLTIPKWLDDAAKEADLNYSRILQDALKEELNLDEGDRSFSVQDKLNKQLKKVKKSLKDLSKIRVHVNMANDDEQIKEEPISETVKKEIEHVKQELNEVADRLKSSEEYQRLNEKINRILEKLNR